MILSSLLGPQSAVKVWCSGADSFMCRMGVDFNTTHGLQTGLLNVSQQDPVGP